MEHPAITYYNQHGYLPREKHYIDEQSEQSIGCCSFCDDEVFEDDEKVIKWEDHYFCDKDCLVEAFNENLVPDEAYRECF
ncbi:hypothetical protein [Gracilibacillus thailandensis]|uniref:Uncharacterized protein n=1 Tax=Gracilibacillus thailandensis TaxID=563735 RepID=A0A6N7QZA5_9BACI|nr:hypothetical protein [Gracilibacillus thailandensis]MRI66221.1 hypothetical protein [Gracilibacillus thailandensis]